MAGTDDIKNENGNAGRFQDESVDEILAGILNKDGTFNDEFGGLLNKYLGEDAAHLSALRGIDLSNRTDEPLTRQRVEFEDPSVRMRQPMSTDQRIEERLPENMRVIYSEAAANAQQPEFTAYGGVRYPSMGIGASEERVVYDADWEEKARQEAARLQRVRDDRMLRGDSTYVRSFVAGGRPMDGRGYRTVSPYIDPLSADEDFDSPYRAGQREQREKKSFFREGPPVPQVRNSTAGQRGSGSAGGRTRDNTSAGGRRREYEDVYDSFASSHESAQAAKVAWTAVDNGQDSRRKHKNNQRGSHHQQKTSMLRDDYDRTELSVQPAEAPAPEEPPEPQPRPPKAKTAAPAQEEFDRVEQTAQGLRSTVAEIVDKYNKRNEEEAAARARALQEELARQEAARIEREKFFKNLSMEIVTAINEDPDGEQTERYDDFTGACAGDIAGYGSSYGKFSEERSRTEEENGVDYGSFLEDINEEPDDGYEDFTAAGDDDPAEGPSGG